MATQSRAPDPPTVLLTRPAAQSARFAAMLEAAFPGQLRCISSPLMAAEWVPNTVPRRDWTALLLTSETGAEAALMRREADRLPDLAFCVGKRTAEVAAAGFTTKVADGDATALLSLVQGAGLGGPMLHLRGHDARGDLAARLTAAGIEAAEVVVYDQRARPLGAEAQTALQGEAPVIVPLFSPRTGQLFVAEAQRIGVLAPLHLAALSPAVAEALAPLPKASLTVADRPDAPAMIAAIRLLLGNLRLS
jgi:uroporphyrinogen-III synthase